MSKSKRDSTEKALRELDGMINYLGLIRSKVKHGFLHRKHGAMCITQETDTIHTESWGMQRLSPGEHSYKIHSDVTYSTVPPEVIDS
jgi:hypothetical protein